MKNVKSLVPLLHVLFAAVSNLSYAQVTTDPALPIADEEVIVYFDATGTSLEGYSGDVYTHTGITVNGAIWQYVIGDWGNNNTQPMLSNIGSDLYALEITPSIRAYYGAQPDDEITQMCFVFRSADATIQTTPDIFVEVYPDELSVSVVSPDESLFFVDPGQQIEITVESFLSTQLSLFVDDELISSTSGNNITETITADTTSDTKHWIIAVAENGANQVYDSVCFFVCGENLVEPLPEGVVDGINYIDDEIVTLVIHAPYKTSIFTIGDFNNWQISGAYRLKCDHADVNDIETRYWITIQGLTPGEEYAFQYLMDDGLRIADAYADKILDPENDAYIPCSTYPNLKPYPDGKTEKIVSVFQTAQIEYSWQVTNFEPPKITDLVIYEMLVRDFTEAANFKTITDTLSYLKRLGINAIEVMPFNEFEGNISWGYNPSFYFAPDKYYGTKNDLKAFIDACHSEGIAVIMDIVLNHAYNQNVFARMYWDAVNNRPAENNLWFNAVCPHEYCWGNDFNHESPYTQHFVDRVNEYWLTEYKIDGFRFDFTQGFTNNNSNWNYDQDRIDIITRMVDEIWTVKEDALVILEHWTENSEETVLANYGCMLWGNLNFPYNEASMGWNNSGSSDFSWISYQERGWNDPHVMGFMESHDEERMMYKNITYGNSNGAYNIQDTTTALKRQELAAVFFYTIPGPKMIWQFGERGYDYSINWPSGEEYDRMTPKPPRWDYMNDERRKQLFKTHQALIYLKKEYNIFETENFNLDVYDATKSITLQDADRNVVVVGNFDVIEQSHTPDWPSTGTYTEYFSYTQLEVNNLNQSVQLAPGEFQLYTTRDFGYVSVKEDKNASSNIQFDFWPNPARNVLQIKFLGEYSGTLTLNIFNASGQKVKMFQLAITSEKSSQRIELSDLQTGIYFLNVTGLDQNVSRKLLIE